MAILENSQESEEEDATKSGTRLRVFCAVQIVVLKFVLMVEKSPESEAIKLMSQAQVIRAKRV